VLVGRLSGKPVRRGLVMRDTDAREVAVEVTMHRDLPDAMMRRRRAGLVKVLAYSALMGRREGLELALWCGDLLEHFETT
jgi:hypothetical protein